MTNTLISATQQSSLSLSLQSFDEDNPMARFHDCTLDKITFFNRAVVVPEPEYSPEEIQELSDFLKRCEIQEKDFNKITKLDLRHRMYAHRIQDKANPIPRAIGLLKNLTELDLSGNSLSFCYDRLPAILEHIAPLKNLKNLNLSNNDMRSIPEIMGSFKSLEELNLSNNYLTCAPDVICHLTNLIDLSLWSNKLTSLPKDFPELKKLENLNLSDNDIPSILEIICCFERLERLDVSGNKIQSIPENIDRLKNLTSLNLSHNKLTSLPNAICQLEKLWNLDITKNQILFLPEEIDQLKNLSRISSYHNKFVSLPVSFGKMRCDISSLEFAPHADAQSIRNVFDCPDTSDEKRYKIIYALDDMEEPDRSRILKESGIITSSHYQRKERQKLIDFLNMECYMFKNHHQNLDLVKELYVRWSVSLPNEIDLLTNLTKIRLDHKQEKLPLSFGKIPETCTILDLRFDEGADLKNIEQVFMNPDTYPQRRQDILNALKISNLQKFQDLHLKLCNAKEIVEFVIEGLKELSQDDAYTETLKEIADLISKKRKNNYKFMGHVDTF